MAIADIVTSERVTRFVRRYSWSEGEHRAGQLLTMRDGSRWFHPYDGSQPVQEKSDGQ